KTLDTNEPAAFGIPMRLVIKPLEDGVPFTDVKYTFTYTASDPANAKVEGDAESSYTCSAPAGFRIWMNKNKTRKKASVKSGGDFVPSGSELTAAEVGMDDGSQLLYVEAAPGAEKFTGDQLLITVKAEFTSPKQGKIEFEDKVRLRPILMQFVTKGENGEIVPTDFVGVCTPRPEVKLADPQVRVAGNSVRVQIRCDEILDPVADNLPEGVGEIEGVTVTVNGSERGTANVRAVAGGAKSFWKQHPYKGTFNPVNLSLPLANLGEGTHTVRVTTSENAAGLSGFAEFSFTLVKETTGGGGGGGGGGTILANIHLPVEPKPQVPDKLQYYFGSREPLEDDPWFEELENQPDSLVFHGELDGEETTVRILGRSPRLTPRIDRFNAQVPVMVIDQISTITGQFTETEPESNLFRCEVRIPGVPGGGGAGRERWVVRDVRKGMGSTQGTCAPFTMRVKGLPDPEEYLGAWDAFPAEFAKSQLAPDDGWFYLKGGSDKIATISDSDGACWLISYDEKSHVITKTVKTYVEFENEKLVGRVRNQDSEVAAKVVFVLGPKIIKPRLKQDLKDNEKLSAIFSDAAPYCYENQAVAGSAPGVNKGIKSIFGIKSIIGGTPSYIQYEWRLTQQAGSLEDTDTLSPRHIPPPSLPSPPYSQDDFLIGLLELKVKKSSLKDLKAVQVFKDHLARDVENFQHGKNCMRKDGVAGIELEDGSLVGGIQLGCASSFVHAHEGKKGNHVELWTRLRKSGWIENGTDPDDYTGNEDDTVRTPGYKWNDDLLEMTIERGWKIYIGDISRPDRHPVTVMETGTVSTARTHSGDTVSGLFRHEKVGDYYDQMLKNVSPTNRRIWVLQPK
ncbi:MAG: hypothetical protein JW808_11820, partial [Victivallales bacterium]|nr:hypothetical protein [Victivallales bacterium]